MEALQIEQAPKCGPQNTQCHGDDSVKWLKKKTRARVLENPTFIQPPLLLQTLTTWSFYPDPLVQTLCVNSTVPISIQSRVLVLSSCPARPCLALLSGVEPSAVVRPSSCARTSTSLPGSV